MKNIKTIAAIIIAVFVFTFTLIPAFADETTKEETSISETEIVSETTAEVITSTTETTSDTSTESTTETTTEKNNIFVSTENVEIETESNPLSTVIEIESESVSVDVPTAEAEAKVVIYTDDEKMPDTGSNKIMVGIAAALFALGVTVFTVAFDKSKYAC